MSQLPQMLVLALILSDTLFLPGSGCRRHPGFTECWPKVPLPPNFPPSVLLTQGHASKFWQFCLCCFELTGYCLVRFSGLDLTGWYFCFISFHYRRVLPGSVVVVVEVVACGGCMLTLCCCLLVPIDLDPVFGDSLHLAGLHVKLHCFLWFLWIL